MAQIQINRVNRQQGIAPVGIDPERLSCAIFESGNDLVPNGITANAVNKINSLQDAENLGIVPLSSVYDTLEFKDSFAINPTDTIQYQNEVQLSIPFPADSSKNLNFSYKINDINDVVTNIFGSVPNNIFEGLNGDIYVCHAGGLSKIDTNGLRTDIFTSTAVSHGLIQSDGDIYFVTTTLPNPSVYLIPSGGIVTLVGVITSTAANFKIFDIGSNLLLFAGVVLNTLVANDILFTLDTTLVTPVFTLRYTQSAGSYVTQTYSYANGVLRYLAQYTGAGSPDTLLFEINNLTSDGLYTPAILINISQILSLSIINYGNNPCTIYIDSDSINDTYLAFSQSPGVLYKHTKPNSTIITYTIIASAPAGNFITSIIRQSATNLLVLLTNATGANSLYTVPKSAPATATPYLVTANAGNTSYARYPKILAYSDKIIYITSTGVVSVPTNENVKYATFIDIIATQLQNTIEASNLDDYFEVESVKGQYFNIVYKKFGRYFQNKNVQFKIGSTNIFTKTQIIPTLPSSFNLDILNATLWSQINNFYKKAPNGTPFYFVVKTSASQISQIVNSVRTSTNKAVSQFLFNSSSMLYDTIAETQQLLQDLNLIAQTQQTENNYFIHFIVSTAFNFEANTLSSILAQDFKINSPNVQLVPTFDSSVDSYEAKIIYGYLYQFPDIFHYGVNLTQATYLLGLVALNQVSLSTGSHNPVDLCNLQVGNDNQLIGLTIESVLGQNQGGAITTIDQLTQGQKESLLANGVTFVSNYDDGSFVYADINLDAITSDYYYFNWIKIWKKGARVIYQTTLQLINSTRQGLLQDDGTLGAYGSSLVANQISKALNDSFLVGSGSAELRGQVVITIDPNQKPNVTKILVVGADLPLLGTIRNMTINLGVKL